MKAHTNNFKEQIKLIGKEIDSKITFGETVLGKSELNAVTPSFQGSILKSAMKQLDIDSNVYIPVGSVLRYEFGLKVNGEYEYINFGNYIVKDVEKQEDTNSYKITCYDKMLLSMKDYAKMPITYPITIRDYINSMCTFLGLSFANKNDTFVNYNKTIPTELYLDSEGNSLGYTFRDVFDELAQVTASTICINDNDEVEIRYINDTGDTIDEEYLKDVNVNFGEKYGKVNSIVLSRSGESDNVYLDDPQSVELNGRCELKIIDNQIMNFNNRDEFLPEILGKLNGIEYYLNDFTSTGVTYYDICDRYNVKIGDATYSCVMFNDEILVTQGLQENIYTEMPKETQTDYTKADKTDRKINQTYLIVDKQNGIIQSLVDKTIYVSDTKVGIGSIKLENAYEGQLYQLSIKGNISLLFPSSQDNLYGYPLAPSDELVPSDTLTPSNSVPYKNEILYPSDELFSKSSILIIDDIEYKLDFDFLNYINDVICDEFIYDNGQCYIIRRVGVNSDGNMYALDNEVIEPRNNIALNVKSNSEISLKSFPDAILRATYLLDNEYTKVFAIQVDVSSEIKQTADEINQKVTAKVGDDEIIAKLNLAVRDGQGIINITGNQVIIESDNFQLTKEGYMYCNNATINNGIIKLEDTQTGATIIEISKYYDDVNECWYGEIYLTKYDGTTTEIRPAKIILTGSSGTDYVSFDGEDGSILCSGDLEVEGNKNRLVKINNGKKVKLNAYETTTPYFGDIGSDKTDENGYCKIEIEDIFSQTIETDDYKVFIQECGEGHLYIEKHNMYFEVKGTPNLYFDWEIKAIQKGYKDIRLQEKESE